MESSSEFRTANRVTGACIGLAAVMFASLGALMLTDQNILGRSASRETSIIVDDETGSMLYDALRVYAKENPDVQVATVEQTTGNIIDTDPSELKAVITDASGNPIGVLSGDGTVRSEDGEVMGTVADGEFFEGTAGISFDGRPYYHVVWGDTLCKVSSAVHFSVQEIARYNKIDNVNLIYAESDLRIPPADWDGLEEPEAMGAGSAGETVK